MRSFFTVILFFVSCSAVVAQSAVDEGEDNQFWNDARLIVWENEKSELALTGAVRVGRNLSLPTDFRGGFSYSYKAAEYLTVTGAYVYRAAFPFRNRKVFENRFSGAGAFNIPLGNKFRLANRHQFEYRANNSRPDTKLYRTRVQVEREITVRKTKITPFGSSEIFYTRNNGWFRIRSIIGVRKELTKKLTGDVYFLRQYDGFSRPGDLNVIGTALRIKL